MDGLTAHGYDTGQWMYGRSREMDLEETLRRRIESIRISEALKRRAVQRRNKVLCRLFRNSYVADDNCLPRRPQQSISFRTERTAKEPDRPFTIDYMPSREPERCDASPFLTSTAPPITTNDVWRNTPSAVTIAFQTCTIAVV